MTLQVNDVNHRGATPVASAFSEAPNGLTKLYAGSVKRGLDVLLVVLSLPIVLPIIVFLAVLVAMDGHNPFYTQNRVGRHGRIFRIYKLRTMIPNAKASLESYLASDSAARAEWEANQKLRNDPRITRLGKLLRNSSLDELPQLINVLKGDMSLIGPRPMMIEQMPIYPGVAYYLLRPGVSGNWQVSDRNGTTFAARAAYDTEYHRDLSLWLDIKIIVRTLIVVLRGTGC
ncbi:sugar transferase [Albibacillus kandeliae]|uniref:sugar transferase n=1 Tax=Albibacillus kandeliae TaxID=2174228 RepID=UPI000D6A008C|nr:sugar transferase [Albibacillus kandeliae]